MIKTISIIVLSVTLFGVVFFLLVKRALKKHLELILLKKKKEK